MRILHVITSLRTGGAEKLMVDLLPRLRDLGHDVDLCVFDGVKTAFYHELEDKGIRIISLREGCGVYDLRNIFALGRIMRDYDIVHTHNTACQLFAAMAGVICPKTSLVTTEHNTSNRRRGRCCTCCWCRSHRGWCPCRPSGNWWVPGWCARG